MGALAGITSQILRSAQGHMKTQMKTKVIWLYGYLGHEDFEALFEMIEPGLRNLQNKPKRGRKIEIPKVPIPEE